MENISKRLLDNGIPAADRYVEIDDNAPEFIESIDATENLIVGLNTANEFGQDSVELAEVEAISSLMKKGKVAIENFRAFAGATLQRLIDQVLNMSVKELATTALSALKAWWETLVA